MPTPPPAAASAEAVLNLLREICLPLDAEAVTLEQADGRVLRQAICAPEDQPLFDRSAVDGYAVRLDDPSTRFRVVDEIRAGQWKPRPLAVGEAVRIATGGALPGAGLQVIMQEQVQREGDYLIIPQRDQESNIRFRGEDARAGEILIPPNTVLRPGTLALLASIGHTRPLVTRLPRIVHLVTGDELVPADQAPGPGQIRDSNSVLVRSFLKQWGVAPLQRRSGEDLQQLQSLWPEVDAAAPDLLLISGGASVGDHDHTRRLLASNGFTIHVSKTSARPGKPLVVAQRGRLLAFGLPGNPLAHFVCLNLYVRAALQALSGERPAPFFHQATLAEDLAADRHARETFWPAVRSWGHAGASLTPLRWRSSGDLTSLAVANALIRVPAGAAPLDRGQQVEFTTAERHCP